MSAFDAANVARAQNGDAIARERLLEALQPILRGFFRKRLGASGDVDDLVQNTLLRVHRGLNQLQQVESLKSFAMKAALFELHDLYRGRYSARETVLDPDFEIADQNRPVSTGLRLDLVRALETLSPHARQIIELREAGYRYIEIAELLETTEAAVKMQVKRAFERLRPMLLPLMLVATTALV